MLIEHLREQWRVRKTRGRVDEVLSFRGDELVLGAGTVLSKARGGRQANGPENDDGRLRALLSVAYRQPIDAAALGHINAAARRWRDGDERQAALHLALSRLGRLEQPADAARRLFMADGLMRAGVAPETILDALDLRATSNSTTLKYSPDQLRIPAGSGRISGEWTSNGGSSQGAGTSASQTAETSPAPQARSIQPHPHASQSIGQVKARTAKPNAPPRAPSLTSASTKQVAGDAHRVILQPSLGATALAAGATIGRSGASLDLGAMSMRALTGLVEFISVLAETGALATTVAAGGTIATLGVLFIPSTGPRGRWVSVGGPGNISFYRNPDELTILFKYTTRDGKQHQLPISPDSNGDYRGPNDNTVARIIKAGAHAGVIVSTENLLREEIGGPKLCPAIVKDNGGELGTAFEDYAKARLNPGNPTPHKMAYPFTDPASGNIVKIDDCQQSTGNPYEYKGPNYENHFVKDDFIWKMMQEKILNQSLNQIRASGVHPLTWVFAEKPVADKVRGMFNDADHGRERIKVETWPWPEKSQ